MQVGKIAFEDDITGYEFELILDLVNAEIEGLEYLSAGNLSHEIDTTGDEITSWEIIRDKINQKIYNIAHNDGSVEIGYKLPNDQI